MEPIKVNHGAEDFPAYITQEDNIFTVTRRYDHEDVNIIIALASEKGYLITARSVHFCGGDSALLRNLDARLAKHCNHCVEAGSFMLAHEPDGRGVVSIPGTEYTVTWRSGYDPVRMAPCSIFQIFLGLDSIGDGAVHKRGCCDLRFSGFVPPNFLTLLEEVIWTIQREVTCSS